MQGSARSPAVLWFSKACSSTRFTDARFKDDSMPEFALKAYAPTLSTYERSQVARLGQPWNARRPTVLTLAGIWTVASALQSLKVRSGTSVTPAPMVTLSSL